MNVNQLIDDLSKAPPVKKATRPAALFLRWFVVSAVYLAVLLLTFGIRPDIYSKLGYTLFTYEIVSLFAMMLSIAVSAILLSYPDIYQKRWMLYMPALPVAAFLYIMFLSYNAEVTRPGGYPEQGAGLECFACICLFSLVPALSLLYYLREQATTHPRLTGSLAVLASVTFGAVAFRFREETDSITHIITAHYLPLIGFAIAGVLLGRKFLRW